MGYIIALWVGVCAGFATCGWLFETGVLYP